MAISETQKVIILNKLRQQFPGWNNFTHPDFVAEEITYKQKAGAKAQELLSPEALQKLIETEDFDGFVKGLKTVAQASNLLFLSMPSSGDLSILSDSNFDAPTFCLAFRDLVHGSDATPERLARYLEYVSSRNLPNKWPFPTYFLFVCHPEDEIFIKPDAVVRPFLKLIESDIVLPSKPDASTYSAIRELSKDIASALEQYQPKDMVDIQSLMWVCAKAGEQKKINFSESLDSSVQKSENLAITPQTRFWKMSPGENAYLWDEWRQNNYIAIGWDHLGDVTQMSHDDLEARRVEIFNHPESFTDANRYTIDRVKQVWWFAHEIKPGDYVIPNNGTTKVLGLGRVSGPCEYHPEAGHYFHRVPVQWLDTTQRTVQQGHWRSTLIELSLEKFTDILKPTSSGTSFTERLAVWLLKNKRTMPEKLQNLRQEFQERFPSQSLRELTLEKYAMGHPTSSDSFCYWLEFQTTDLGSVKGGNAAKWGVYWSQDLNTWRWNKMYKSADDALKRITDGLDSLIEAVNSGNFNDLDTIGAKKLGQNRLGLRCKPLALYFPDEFLPISSPKHLECFLSYFGLDPQGEVLSKNR